jgi:hypothetical protein
MAESADSDVVAAKADEFAQAIEGWGEGESEKSLAKVVIAIAAIVSGSPWAILAEPLLSRLFVRLNNGAGKAAVAEIAKEVEDDEQRRELVKELASVVPPLLDKFMGQLSARDEVRFERTVDAVDNAAAELSARFALLIHRSEERLISQIAPRADVWRSLAPGTRAPRGNVKPSALLVASHEAVPFVGRDSIFDDLEPLLKNGPFPAIGLLLGTGGTGKTRFAIELCARLRATGVLAGFLPHDGGRLHEVCSGEDFRVVIVDDASGRSAQLRALLRDLANDAVPPIFVLLLARDVGEWWESLARAPGVDPSLIHNAATIRLDESRGQLSRDERVVIWNAAVARFGSVNGDSLPPDFEDPTFGRPLPLLMHALLTVHGASPGTEPELLRHVLDYELQHQSLAVAQLGLDQWRERDVTALLRRCLAIASLLGGVDAKRLHGLVRLQLQQAFDAAPQALVVQIVQTLAALYPTPSESGDRASRIAPLEPILLGEELAVREIAEAKWVLGAAVEMSESKAELCSILRLLDQNATRVGDKTWLVAAVREHLAKVALPALEVAIEAATSTDPLALALAEELARLGVECAALSEQIEAQCPTNTTALTSVALAATEIALAAARAALASEYSDLKKAHVAVLANNLANRLRAVGRVEDSLAPARESTVLNRELHRDYPAFAEPLATSLTTLAATLGQLHLLRGHLNAAIEACSLRAGLYTIDPDRFAPDFAHSLNGVATAWLRSDRAADAIKAAGMSVDLRRQLAATDPATYRPGLAASLLTQASALRKVAEANAALESAQECALLYEDLVATRADEFKRPYAASLANFSAALGDVGRSEAALLAGHESVRLLRQLFVADPDAFAADYVISLDSLAGVQTKAKLYGEALDNERQAVLICRSQSADGLTAFDPELERCLQNLVFIEVRLGLWESVFEHSEERATLLLQLAEQDFDRFAPEAAETISYHCRFLRLVGRWLDADSWQRRIPSSAPNAAAQEFVMSANALRLVEIPREEIDKGEVEWLVHTIADMVPDREIAATRLGSLLFTVSGYNDDPRALWDIDEVHSWFVALETYQVPWFWLLDPEVASGSLRVLACCAGATRNADGVLSLDAERVQAFVLRNATRLTTFAAAIGLDDSQVSPILDKILKFFVSGEAAAQAT